jgi:Domain of unknown function (DUF4209)
MLRLAAAARGLTDADTARLASLADRLLAQRPARPFLSDGAAAVLTGLDPRRRADTDEARFRARILDADCKPPAARLVLLEQAAGFANRLGRKDLAGEATRAMQAIDKDALGLTSITAEASIQAEIVDIEAEQMSAGASWQEALDSWLASVSPTGDPDENDLSVRRLAAASGLRRLLPTVLLGADGLPRWLARSEQDELNSDLAWTEKYHIAIRGRMLADALDRVGAVAPPDPDELALHLSDRGAGRLPLAAAAARAFGRYWDGDYESSPHTAAPRIEAAARELVLSLDIAAYQVARATEPGKYVGLDALIGLLADAGLDRSWERFLRTLLTGPLGMNLRNDTAHGFVIADPGRETAALALRALGLLVRLLGPPADLSGAPAAALPRDGCGTVVFTVASLARAAARCPADIPGLFFRRGPHPAPAARAGRRMSDGPHRKKLVSMAMDRASGTAEVVLSDGTAARMPFGGTPFSPSSRLVRVEFLPRRAVLRATTNAGDHVEYELPSPERFADPLGGRPVVYLDQNQWSAVSNALQGGGRPAAPEGGEAALRLAELAEKALVVLPASGGHLLETGKWSDADRRYRLGLTVARLSRGWQMRDPVQVRRDELHDMFRQRRGVGTGLRMTPVFTLDSDTMFGAWRNKAEGHADEAESTSPPPDAQALARALISATVSIDVLLDADHTPEGERAGWHMANQRFSDWLDGERRDTQQKRNSIDAFLLSDLQRDIAEEAFAAGSTPEQMSEWIRTGFGQGLSAWPLRVSIGR